MINIDFHDPRQLAGLTETQLDCLPFGALLVLNPTRTRIEAASAHLDLVLGINAKQVLGKSLPAVFPLGAADLLTHLQNDPPADLLRESIWTLPSPRSPDQGPSETLKVRLHAIDPQWLLEIEQAGAMPMDERLERLDIEDLQRRLLACERVDEVCGRIVEAIRVISGYERVLAYRFEPDETGLIVAESLLEGAWPSILGLRYPVTDIPQQSRTLSLATPLRYALTRDYPGIHRRLIGLANQLAARVVLLEERAAASDAAHAARRVDETLARIDDDQPFPECFLDQGALLSELMQANGILLQRACEPSLEWGRIASGPCAAKLKGGRAELPEDL